MVQQIGREGGEGESELNLVVLMWMEVCGLSLLRTRVVRRNSYI